MGRLEKKMILELIHLETVGTVVINNSHSAILNFTVTTGELMMCTHFFVAG